MKTVDFSETIAASDLKVGRCRQLIEIMKVPYVSIEGQGHFLTIYFPGFVCTRPRYQVSVYRTIGPLVYISQCLTMESAILLILSRDQNRKTLIFRVWLCFALENSSS